MAYILLVEIHTLVCNHNYLHELRLGEEHIEVKMEEVHDDLVHDDFWSLPYNDQCEVAYGASLYDNLDYDLEAYEVEQQHDQNEDVHLLSSEQVALRFYKKL